MLSNITKINGYNPIKALFLKEFWDNKRAIFTTPMVVAGLVMFFSIVGFVNGSGMMIDGESIRDHLSAPHDMPDDASGFITLFIMIPSLIIGVAVTFSIIFIALSILYDERKDKSILFWKSMPVSDTQEVFVKLATITIVAPMVAVGFAIIVQIFSALLFGLFVATNTDFSAWEVVFSNINLIGLITIDIIVPLVNILWALPIIAWFMLVSSFSRRSPFLLAFIAPILVAVFEGVFFGSSYLLEAIASRFSFIENIGNRMEAYFELDDKLSLFDLAGAYLSSVADLNFWYGFIVAVAMIAGCIQIRKRNSIA